MTRTTHRMKALCPFALDAIEVEITYTYLPGAPEQGPTYSSGGQPADPDEVEFVSVGHAASLLSPPLQKMLDEWAIEYLASDDGFAAAVDHAEDDESAARERAAEYRRER